MIQLGSETAAGYIVLGNLYASRRLRDQAEEAYRKALALDPDSAVVHLGLGHYHRSSRRSKKADAAYNKARKLDPKNFLVLWSLGELRLMEGKRDEASRPSV